MRASGASCRNDATGHSPDQAEYRQHTAMLANVQNDGTRDGRGEHGRTKRGFGPHGYLNTEAESNERAVV